MTPTLLAASLLLLGQVPASPFPVTPPPAYAPAPAAAAETESDGSESDDASAALAAALEAAASSAEDSTADSPDDVYTDNYTQQAPLPETAPAVSPAEGEPSDGPALVPIGQSPPAAATASLPELGVLPAEETPVETPVETLPATVAPAVPAEFPIPPAAEMRSVLIEPESGAIVQPATSQEPLASPASTRLSQIVLRRLLTAPDSQALAGQPTRLGEVLPIGGERTKQVEAVQAYWESTLRTAVYHATLADLDRLASVPAPAAGRERTVFEQALLAAEANARQAELKAVDAQYVLAEKAGLTIDNLLPLPADEPLTGGYRTHYDTLFAGRTAPVNLRRIDRTLPLCQRLLETRAASLVAAEEVWETELAAYQRGEISLELLLVSFDRLGSQRIAFLELVRRYNFDIADFALSVSTAGSSRETIVGMLIETNGRSGGVVRAVGGFAPVPAGTQPTEQGMIIQGAGGPVRVIPGQPTPAVPVETLPSTTYQAPPQGHIVPGQPLPSATPTPATPAPASSAPTLQTPSPASGAAATLPSPAEVAGQGAFRDVTPGRETIPAPAGEVRLAQATGPLGGSSPSTAAPTLYAEPAPRSGRIVDTPAPPGLEGTQSVLVRP